MREPKRVVVWGTGFVGKLVIAEIVVLPLAFGAIAIAGSFSAVNLMLIVRRVRIEESVLAARRGL